MIIHFLYDATMVIVLKRMRAGVPIE